MNNNIPPSNSGKNTDDVCLTAGCIHAASNALDQIDDTVEPCDDFYGYACGSFVKNTMIPDEKVSVNTFSLIGDKLQEQLRALISEKADPNDSKPFNLAKNLYTACMNKSLIEERGLKPLLDITDSLGGWPVVKGDRWNDKSDWTWIKAVKDFRKIGYSMDYIFDFSVGIDLKNSTARTIDVSTRTEIHATTSLRLLFLFCFSFDIIDDAGLWVDKGGRGVFLGISKLKLKDEPKIVA